GDADFSVSATASSGLAVSFTAAGQCTIAMTTVHITTAGSCTLTAHQAGDGNYNAAPDVPQTFAISTYLFSVCDANGHCVGGSHPNEDGIGAELTITSSVPYIGNATVTVDLSPATLDGLESLTSPGVDAMHNPLPPQFKVWIAPNADPTHPVFFGTGTATQSGDGT